MTDLGQHRIPAGIHDAAGRWLARRQSELSLQSEREFKTWIEADPRHRRAYDEAMRHWRDSAMLGQSAVGRTRKLARAPWLMRRSTHVGAAGLGLAAVLGLITVGLVRSDGRFSLVSPAEAAVYRTSIGQIRTVRLADGSLVTLDTDTSMRVSFTARSRRLVLERGRARFRVAADSRRPFVVALPGGEVVARGAVFDVSVAAHPAKIAAIEGPVELRSAGADPAAAAQRLAPGEQTLLGSGAAPRPVSQAEARWVSGMLGLDDVPLGDAVAAINRYNVTQVRLGDQRLAGLSVTGAFRARDPREFAHAVAAAFNLDVDISSSAQITLAPRKSASASSPQN